MRNPQSNLPPGFRFHPTDEELILHYLRKKVVSAPIPVSIIAEVDIYKFDPWDLPGKAVFGEKEWYFFSPRDRKYPNGVRPNRAAASGYWKATGTDKTIVTSLGGGEGQEHLGVKKALVFYKGRPPKGVKTNWIMHEYRLMDNNKPVKFKDSSMRLDDWVLCRIYKKSKYVLPPTPEETFAAVSDQDQDHLEQFVNGHALLPNLKPSPGEETLLSQKSLSFSNLFDAMDYSILSSFLSENPSNSTQVEPAPELHGGVMQQSFQNNKNSYLFQKLPELNSPSPMNMESHLKRQNTIMAEDTSSYPSNKFLNSYGFLNNSHQTDTPQCNFPNRSLLVNQQLILSPHLSFQG